MVSKIQNAKKILNALNKLDAQFLVGYPKPLSLSEYTKRRSALKKRFRALK